MFAVIFEVNPRPEQWESYLGYARLLRPELEQIDGFIANERFSSRRREGWHRDYPRQDDRDAATMYQAAGKIEKAIEVLNSIDEESADRKVATRM